MARQSSYHTRRTPRAPVDGLCCHRMSRGDTAARRLREVGHPRRRPTGARIHAAPKGMAAEGGRARGDQANKNVLLSGPVATLVGVYGKTLIARIAGMSVPRLIGRARRRQRARGGGDRLKCSTWNTVAQRHDRRGLRPGKCYNKIQTRIWAH
jgi:hypothetical protein